MSASSLSRPDDWHLREPQDEPELSTALSHGGDPFIVDDDFDEPYDEIPTAAEEDYWSGVLEDRWLNSL